MDLAKAFEILSLGRIVSCNSSQYREISNMLLGEAFYEELRNLVDKIGYRLVGENGYFYMTRCKKMTTTELDNFINKHRELIVSIAFLRRLYPRLDRGSIISFVDTVGNYVNTKRDDTSIQGQLVYCSKSKNIDDEKSMMEMMFKQLEGRDIIERLQSDNADQFKVLDAINYYLSIVDSVEQGGDDA